MDNHFYIILPFLFPLKFRIDYFIIVVKVVFHNGQSFYINLHFFFSLKFRIDYFIIVVKVVFLNCLEA